jgi:hypothetical protein
MDKNKRFRERYGLHDRWDWNSESATITLSDPTKPALRINATVVGTIQEDSWEWTWANPNFATQAKLGMEQVREFGEKQGYEKLTSAFLDADEHTGWEMTAVAAHILNAPGAYRFSSKWGYCYLIYRKIEEIDKEMA